MIVSAFWPRVHNHVRAHPDGLALHAVEKLMHDADERSVIKLITLKRKVACEDGVISGEGKHILASATIFEAWLMWLNTVHRGRSVNKGLEHP
jgi:hypothetical protein